MDAAYRPQALADGEFDTYFGIGRRPDMD